jgi:hypothetical protein
LAPLSIRVTPWADTHVDIETIQDKKQFAMVVVADGELILVRHSTAFCQKFFSQSAKMNNRLFFSFYLKRIFSFTVITFIHEKERKMFVLLLRSQKVLDGFLAWVVCAVDTPRRTVEM